MALKSVIQCGCCLVLGGTAGYHLHSASSAVSPVAGQAQAQAAAGRGSGQGGTSALSTPAGPGGAGDEKTADQNRPKADGAPEDMTTLSSRLKDLMDHFNRKDARKAADELSVSELQTALGLLTSMPKSSERDSLRSVLFQAWAKKDAAAAWKAALAESKPKDEESLSAVASELAKAHPEMVMGMAMGLGKGAIRTEALRSALEEWGRNDLPGALAYLSKHPGLPVPYWTVGQAVGELADKDPVQAAKLVAGLSDMQTQRYAISSVLQAWAKTDPNAALDWAQNVPGQGLRRSAITQAISTWGSQDPRAAMEAAQALKDPGLRADAVKSGWASWFQANPDEAMRYLAGGSADDLAHGAGQGMDIGWIFTNGASAMTAEEASALLKQLPEGKVRDDIVSSIASHNVWNGQFTQALTLLNNLPDSQSRDSTLQELGSQWGDVNPDAAAAWLRQQPDSSDRDVAVSGFVAALARTDPRGALQWSDTINDDGVKSAALKNILIQWLVSDPAAAGAWMNASTALSDSDKQDLRESAIPGRNRMTYTAKVTNRR